MKRLELRRIVAGVLEVDPGLLAVDTDLTAIETFDSVNVLLLMIELDRQAGLRLDPGDAGQLRYYGDIERLAERRGITLEN